MFNKFFKKHACLVSYFIILGICSELIRTTCAQRLHDDEVRTLQQIAKTMGGPLTVPKTCGLLDNVNITCNVCNNDNTLCYITELRLKDASLSGTLPDELVNLKYLEKFDITRNFLQGPLPANWSTMKNLNFISLTANRLSGEIPKEWGNFPNLTYLSFEANNFTGRVPDELGNLVNVENLIFSSNKFVGTLPNSLEKLTKLQDLRLSDNNFEGPIPEFIESFTQLTRLELFASGLEGPIPTTMFQNMENLKDLLITDMAGPESQFPTIVSTVTEINLVLRNVKLSGTIPESIWKMMSNLDMLDVSFNNLVGAPSAETNTAKHIFLTGNKINGSVPYSFLINSKSHNIDLSYNNLTWSAGNCENKLEKVNTYRSSSLTNTNELFPCSDQPNCRLNHKSSLHINCGGPSVTIKNGNGSLVYEDDTFDGYSSAHSYSRTYWGFSSTGEYMNDNNKESNYVKENDRNGNLGLLYTTARRSPLSLAYFACLKNGNYTVKLHFAEMELEAFRIIGRRLFDIYIQGNRVSQDFNIDEEANRSGNEAVVKQYFDVSVADNTLEIRFYWAGKGTRVVPSRGNYGIFISAISVCPSSKSHCEEHERSITPIVAGAVSAFLFLVFLGAGFIAWRIRHHKKYARESELRGLELKTGSFTLRQLRAATNNFDPANKIGEGGFGIVYKGQLLDGTFIAVKQMSSKSRQGNREFVTEIGMISGLQHSNLVKLYGCCIERNQLLLVYEYMENNCLARALFGKNNLELDWATRFNICMGIAKGLHFLHEGSPLRIVHRDIKATNILLDKDLSAKISDFGLAKLYEEDNTHVSTRIAGTIGYMAPEYALWGNLTEKADVYSFGVLVLEIVGGQSNTNTKLRDGCVCLIDHAFVLQNKGDLLEIMDPRLGSVFDKKEAERAIKVALLCTNASPFLRPTMSEAIDMLQGHTIAQEIVSDPCIYSNSLANDVRFKPFKDYYQRTQNDNTAENCRSSSLSNAKSIKTSSSFYNVSSDRDLYKINPDFVTISGNDLYPLSLNSTVNTSDVSSLMSKHTP